MGYLPAVIVAVVGLLVMVVLVVVLVGHLRRTSRAANGWQADVRSATESLRSGAGTIRGRRAGGG